MKFPINVLIFILLGVSFCRGDGFRVQTRIDVGAKEFPESNVWHAAVVDANGTVQYALERKIPYGSPYPSLSVSPEKGFGVCLNAFDGSVDFFDSTGVLLRSWHPFGASTPDHERILKSSLSRTSSAILWSASDGSGAFVALFTPEGEAVWERGLSGRSGGEVQIAEEGDFVLAGSYTYEETPLFSSELFDARSERIGVLPRPFSSAQLCRPAGSTLPVIGMTDGKALYRWQSDQDSGSEPLWILPGDEEFVTDVTVENDGTILALVQQVAAGEFGIRYGEARLLATGSTGVPVEIQRFLDPGASRLTFLRIDGDVWVSNDSGDFARRVSDSE